MRFKIDKAMAGNFYVEYFRRISGPALLVSPGAAVAQHPASQQAAGQLQAGRSNSVEPAW